MSKAGERIRDEKYFYILKKKYKKCIYKQCKMGVYFD